MGPLRAARIIVTRCRRLRLRLRLRLLPAKKAAPPPLLLLRLRLGPILIADEHLVLAGARLVGEYDGLGLELGQRQAGKRSLLLDLELLSISFGRHQSEAHQQAEQRTHMHHEDFQ